MTFRLSPAGKFWLAYAALLASTGLAARLWAAP